MPILNKPYITPATAAQKNYIEILSNDLGLSRASRNTHISGIVKRLVSDLDDLGRSEASSIIERFKEWKETQQK